MLAMLTLHVNASSFLMMTLPSLHTCSVRSMLRRLSVLLCVSMLCLAAGAAPLPCDSMMKQAGIDYRAHRYQQAHALYSQCVQQPAVAADANLLALLYYNMGNCQSRLSNYAEAVLCYERALRLDPSHADAAYNLQWVRAKLTDRFDAPAQMFFISWMQSWLKSQSHRTWGMWALGLFVVSLLALGVCVVSQRYSVRRLAFIVCLAALLLSLMFHIFAYSQYRRFHHECLAVIMAETACYDTPTSSATPKSQLHEGTVVQVLHASQPQWYQVQQPDGKTWWVKCPTVELVAKETLP